MPSLADRHLLIALVMTPIHRAAVCRLGASMDRWADVRGALAARDAAGRLGIPIGQLRRALDVRHRASILAAEEERRAAEADARVVTLLDADYPPAFCDLPLPPPVLYQRGSAESSGGSDASSRRTSPAIAMVGSRKPDAYGLSCAERFARKLAHAGLTVVSGFAIGVDQACHRAALSEPTGHTVAVLGCGIDIDYPAHSRALARDIAARGALISELPMGIEPRPHHFPMRNRLIAALGLGVLVVQAKARSGSLITAHHALDLGRDVWAIPGPIDSPLASGSNGLIADGAMLVQAPADVLAALSLDAQQTLFPSRKTPIPAAGWAQQMPVEAVSSAAPANEAPTGSAGGPPSPRQPRGLEAKVLQGLDDDRSHSAEALAQDTGTTIDRILGCLLELELEGRIKRLPGPLYARA